MGQTLGYLRDFVTKYGMVQHRRPPKPESWFCPRGTCRFCGDAIIENGKQNNRKHWHAGCATTWKIMNDPTRARDHVLKRDKRTCQGCGAKHVPFQVDHVKPLFEANGDLSYWKAENLILLCVPCHVVKTRTDMGRYRELISAKPPAEIINENV